MKSWPCWGQCGILQLVLMESEKYWQICMWIWNSGTLLKLGELLKQPARANWLQWSAYKPYFYIYLLACSEVWWWFYFYSALLGTLAPIQQFSPACSLLMYCSVSEGKYEISSATATRSTITSGRYRSPVCIFCHRMGWNIISSVFVQGKGNLLSCTYLSQEKSLPYCKNW